MIRKSELDSKRFGLNIYRVTSDHVPVAVLGGLFQESADVDVVILRVPLSEIPNLNILDSIPNIQRILADVQVYCSRKIEPLEQFDVFPNPSVSYREGTKQDRPQIEAVIRESFAEYRSHYDANPLFNRKDILDGYVEFALSNVNEFDKKSYCTVVEYENEGIVGFNAFSYSSEEKTLASGLIGISKKARNMGLYRNLLRLKFNFASSLGASSVISCTRADNISVIRNWIRDGYLIDRTEITVHLNRKAR